MLVFFKPAFLAIESRLGDGFGNGEQVSQIDGGVPARVVVTLTTDTGVGCPLLEFSYFDQSLGHLRFLANDADQILHGILKLRLNGVGRFTGSTTIKR